MGRSLSQPQLDERAQALKTIYDGLRIALDGAYQYQLACIRLDGQAVERETRAEVKIAATINPAPIQTDKQELNVKELAARWGVSTRSIYQWRLTGGLPFKKAGRLLRFDLAEAEAWRKPHQESFTHARLRVVK